jgi:hypothetical protein
MTGFLERWVEESKSSSHGDGASEPNAPALDKCALADVAIAPFSREIETRGMSWADWEAAQLNKCFADGRSQRPARVNAEGLNTDRNHGTRHQPKHVTEAKNEQFPTPDEGCVSSFEALGVLEVQRKIAGLLALCYRRHASIQQVSVNPARKSDQAGLASPDGPSVHGVVP